MHGGARGVGHDQQFIQAAMAHAMGIEVLAKGVENSDVVRELDTMFPLQ